MAAVNARGGDDEKNGGLKTRKGNSGSRNTKSNVKPTERNEIMKQAHRIVSGVVLALLLAALPGAAAEAKAEGGRKVNVNSADSAQLSLLPRVGPSVAQRIVEYRKQNGPFKKAEDLMLVQGIGEKTYQLLKPYVAIAGETTLKEKVRSSRSSSGKDSR
jgi:competence ComEA-like helix-hairpin-helix protein